MCGRFSVLTWDEFEAATKAVLFATPLNVDPDWPATRPDAFPGSTVRAIVAGNGQTPEGEGGIRAADFIWGFPMPNQAKTAFNARSESLATSPFWKESFLCRRCVVPAAAFFEPHREEMGIKPPYAGRPEKKVKQTYRFVSKAGLAILLAGIWQEDRLSIVTTEPDDSVSPVHDRMPLVLSFDQALPWIESAEAATSLISSRNPALPESAVPLVAAPIYPTASESAQLSLF